MSGMLKGKKILVTGGCGFIGSHIVEKLLEYGAKVTVLDNLYTGKEENLAGCCSRVTMVREDIRNRKVLAKLLRGTEFVCHQAALRSVPKSVECPEEYHDVNVTGTFHLLLEAKTARVKRVVFASSSSVYGDRTDFPERETDLPKPVSPYAATKLLCEHYGYLFSKLYKLGVVGLRYFNVFGPRQSLENQYAVVVPKFITTLLRKERPPIYGDGTQERDFTYIENVVTANILALSKEKIEGEIFNVALGKPYSVNGLFSALQKIIGTKVTPRYLAVRRGDVYKTQADTRKLRLVLGLKKQISFEEGLSRTVSWFQQQFAAKR